jgi:sensor histidine kinase YesM
MKKYGLEIILHITFWLSTAWLIASSYSIEAHEINIINGVEKVNIVRNNGLVYQILLIILVSAISFYLNIWLVFKRNQAETNKIPIRDSALTFASALIVIAVLTDLRFFSDAPPLPKQLAFGILVFYFALSVNYSLVKLWIYNNQRQHQLILDKRQAELNLVRNQLQPHFLFNALNNLLSMVNPAENPKLVASFEQLSQLLRYVIEGTKAEKVSVAKEIEFLKNYIELQKLRFKEGEVDVQFKVVGPFTTQKVEPGLFIAFVENAFKYGTEPEESVTIDIAFDLSEPNTVHFKVKNKVLMKNINGVGTGIDATRKRLALIYPKQHKLSVSNENDFLVQLTIRTT